MFGVQDVEPNFCLGLYVDVRAREGSKYVVEYGLVDYQLKHAQKTTRVMQLSKYYARPWTTRYYCVRYMLPWVCSVFCSPIGNTNPPSWGLPQTHKSPKPPKCPAQGDGSLGACPRKLCPHSRMRRGLEGFWVEGR